jgi:asparaginyl-tRNA synthetase
MAYSDAIDWLKANGVMNEFGAEFEHGMDIAEAAERKMTDTINQVHSLTTMRDVPADPAEPLPSRDQGLLHVALCRGQDVDGVGGLVDAGSGRDRRREYEDLATRRVGTGIPKRRHRSETLLLVSPSLASPDKPDRASRYTDQRVYGSCPHGGYGLGLERFVCWLTNTHHIRDVCLYPRFIGRCAP